MTDELFNKRVGKYNYGLIIAIPCKDGTIPVEWFLHMDYVTHSMPVGLAWKYCFYKHLPVQEARQKCVEYARRERAKFILFIDDDSVVKNTPIIIKKNGYINIIEIQDLIPNFLKNWDNERIVYVPKEDIETLSQDGWTKIKYVYAHKINEEINVINTNSGIVEVTKGHSLVKNRQKIKSSDIKIGDFIDHLNFISSDKKIEINEEMAWLYGFFAAEGHTSRKEYQYNWSICQKDKKLLDKSKYILEKNTSHKFTIKNWQNMYQLISNGSSIKELYKIFRDKFYTLSGYKKIPIEILNSDDVIKWEFLKGLWDGDGSWDKVSENEFIDSKSPTLAMGITYLLSTLGKKYSVYARKDKKIYTIRKIRNPERENGKRTPEDTVKIIRKYQYNDYVYDLETESHTFAGGIGNIVLHNTFIPVDSIVKMMRHQKDIVSGVVWTKRDPTEPVIFKECGLGPWYDFPKNQLVKIEAAGLACTLINMEIFDKLESPYFRIGWSRIQEGLENQKVSSTGTGEDTWFFQSCKNAGIEVYADTSVLCDHLDRQTGRIFPGEEVVNKYTSPEKDMYYKLKQIESNVVVVREHTREMTERCVDYIKINTRLRNNVTVVDKDFIEGQLYFGADLVYKDIIRGYELINKIYENLSGHYLVMLNDNVLVKDGWLSRMIQLQQKDGAAIVYDSPEKNIILIPYKTLTDHGKFEENYEEKLKSIGARIRFVEEKICDVV